MEFTIFLDIDLETHNSIFSQEFISLGT